MLDPENTCLLCRSQSQSQSLSHAGLVVHVRHIQYCHFRAALQSDMSLQDCTAVGVDGATTKIRCEKKCCENMPHELVYLYSAFRSVGSKIRLSFDIWHHPFKWCPKFAPIHFRIYDDRLDTQMEHQKTSDTNETSTFTSFFEGKRRRELLYSPLKTVYHTSSKTQPFLRLCLPCARKRS